MSRPRQDPVLCGCGCGTLITPRNDPNRPNRFAFRTKLSPRFAEVWLRVSYGVDDPADPSCWEWTGRINERGYGTVSRNGEHYAHRAAWVQVNGPIPDGLNVLHRCDTPPCVRPSHLFLGTFQDNTDDMIAKGRAPKPKPVDVEAVVAAYTSGESLTAVQDRFRISHGRLRKVLREHGVAIRYRGERAACHRGHEFTPENTARYPNGARRCRRCGADSAARARRRSA